MEMIREWSRDQQIGSREHAKEIQRQLTIVRDQQDRLLNLRQMDEIDSDAFLEKTTDLRDRVANLTLQLEAADRSRAEQADLAMKVIELSQSLKERWMFADYKAKCRVLEKFCLNFTLDGATLVPEIRSPFDLLIEGLKNPSSRGDWTAIELFVAGLNLACCPKRGGCRGNDTQTRPASA